MRTLLAALAVLLPARARRVLYVRLLGHEIDPAATVGHSFVDVEHLRMGPSAVIGHLCVIRGAQDVELGTEALVGNLNFVNAVGRTKAHFAHLDRHPALIMGDCSRISTMHFVDCSDRVELGEHSGIGGVWTMVLTHTYAFDTATQVSAPVTIGARSVVSTRCTLLPGAALAERSILAASSLLAKPVEEIEKLYAGTPAKPVRDLDADSPYFRRTSSRLHQG
ncbi:acyltransferase [Actinomycetospora aeridis]|uniref:Acyltransferase n=1 Tax=Actinomycetospora aeridis TaxID=3129231 RepID=A0ABU8N6H1_9PSEU